MKKKAAEKGSGVACKKNDFTHEEKIENTKQRSLMEPRCCQVSSYNFGHSVKQHRQLIKYLWSPLILRVLFHPSRPDIILWSTTGSLWRATKAWKSWLTSALSFSRLRPGVSLKCDFMSSCYTAPSPTLVRLTASTEVSLGWKSCFDHVSMSTWNLFHVLQHITNEVSRECHSWRFPN